LLLPSDLSLGQTELRSWALSWRRAEWLNHSRLPAVQPGSVCYSDPKERPARLGSSGWQKYRPRGHWNLRQGWLPAWRHSDP